MTPTQAYNERLIKERARLTATNKEQASFIAKFLQVIDKHGDDIRCSDNIIFGLTSPRGEMLNLIQLAKQLQGESK